VCTAPLAVTRRRLPQPGGMRHPLGGEGLGSSPWQRRPPDATYLRALSAAFADDASQIMHLVPRQFTMGSMVMDSRLHPSFTSSMGSAESPGASGLRAREVASLTGICVQALALARHSLKMRLVWVRWYVALRLERQRRRKLQPPSLPRTPCEQPQDSKAHAVAMIATGWPLEALHFGARRAAPSGARWPSLDGGSTQQADRRDRLRSHT